MFDAGAEFKVVAVLELVNLQVAQNVYYVKYDGTVTASEEQVGSDMAIWVEEMYDRLEAQIADVVSLTEIITSHKVSADPLVYEEIAIVAGSFVGLDTGEPLPGGVAFVTRIATVALKSIARKYVPGFAVGQAIDGIWGASAIIAGILYMGDWLAGPPTQGLRTWIPGIISVKDGLFKEFRATAILSTIPGYQRRRKPGVGI